MQTESAYAEHLISLERLTTEFFAGSTPNERKKEIDSMFQEFNKRSDSWKHCLYFIQKSECQYVNMFSLTSIENTVLKKWPSLTYPDRVELKNFLWDYFTNNIKTHSFIRNKIAKLVVDVARHDWPSSYPQFFSQILELLESGGHAPVLGLIMVRAIVEGLGAVSGSEQRLLHLPQQRRKELQQLFHLYIPQLLNILMSVLDRLAQTQLSDNSFPNPPPSPERCMRNIASSDLPDLLTSSNTPFSRCGNQASREECVNLCLGTLQQIFLFLPHASNLPMPLVSSLFHWASIATQTEFDEDICINGMSSLNELLYQRHVTTRSLIVSNIISEIFKLLNHLISPPNSPVVNNLSEMYVNKVSEFLQLFISLYFKSLDSEPDFDSKGFLLLLFQYTFQVSSFSSFLSCLEIWNHFLDTLKPQDVAKYSEALLGLVSGIGNKIQFRHNGAQLQQIDNDNVNDDGETEWQVFLRNCVECVAKVAEFAPLHMFNHVLEVWHPLAEAHENESATYEEMVDLTSFTQLLGRLAPTLFLDKEEAMVEENVKFANIFLEKLMKLIQFCARKCTDGESNLNSSNNIYSLVHSGALACMGSWTHYIPRCSAPSCTVPALTQTAAFLLVDRKKKFPDISLHASAHMLLSITVTMHPTEPLQYIPDLYVQAQQTLNHLPPKTATVVRQALCTMILECPMNDPSNGEAKRMQACSFLISAWCSTLLNPTPNSTPVEQLACLPALTHLLKYFADHPTNAKKILATAVEKPVQAALEVFQNSSNSPGSENNKVAPIVLDMFLALLRALHHQLGNVFIRSSIHMFLDIAKRKSDALQQLLCVLQVGVEGGSLANSAALEEVLTMCLDHVLPLVQANDTDSDVTYALFNLFGSILLNRWQHFYSSCVRQGWSPVGPEGASDGAQTDHLSHFCAIMHAIISSFLTDNIEVVRLNLRNMDFLNIRYKLYTKLAFQQQLLGQTLQILLRVLIQRTAVGTLLQEEVITTCYNLASVDFTTFFDSFLPSFLGNIQNITFEEYQGLLAIPKDTDLPSFTQNILRFTNDIHCYQMSREISF